jgi:prolipoprotein diacylglyceryltransferase
MWLMLVLLAIGRFVEFFLRSDSADLALGLETAQWTSLLLLTIALPGAWLTVARRPAPPRDPPPPARTKRRRQQT